MTDDPKLTKIAQRLMSVGGRLCEYGRIIECAAKIWRDKDVAAGTRLKALECQSTAILRAGQEAQEQALLADNEALRAELEDVKALLESVRSGHSPYADDTPPPPRRGEATH